MGYSTPKKQLDLKEFLSTPAKRLPYKKKFSQVQVARKTQDETEQNGMKRSEIKERKH